MTSTKSYRLSDARSDHPLWFERDAMRFFGTRIHEERTSGNAVYVITSEQPPHGPRTWNVRRFTADQSDTLGPPIDRGYGSHDRARSAATALAAAERDGWIAERPDRDTYQPCAAYGGCSNAREFGPPSWAAFTVDHPTDPDMSGLYCPDCLPAVIGYPPC